MVEKGSNGGKDTNDGKGMKKVETYGKERVRYKK